MRILCFSYTGAYVAAKNVWDSRNFQNKMLELSLSTFVRTHFLKLSEPNISFLIFEIEIRAEQE